MTGFSVLHGQDVRLEGQVLDTIKNPIPFTNIIATPLVQNLHSTFAITNTEGHYKLNLQKSISYRIEISHLGFSNKVDTLNIDQNTNKTYVLEESLETLDQILIKQKMAVIVKKDTIIYRTDHFKTGEERKLREVLKKLPGVEVDREGNVKVNGKKVTKLMVEGKTFFTGDAKLAVNNIPADVVDEIEALDNYSEIAFLKGLIDSNQMALNIKLKADKKEFVFGDLETGAGIDNRFLLHPTLFYYSPKTAINVIADVNNIGKKSFTMRDYINFEGGFTSLLDGSTSFADVYNSDFAQFLNQKDFVFQKNDFGAGSIFKQLNRSVRLEAFSIINKGKTHTRNNNIINYLTDDGTEEHRETSTNNNAIFTLTKLKLRHQPNVATDLTYNTFIKTSNGNAFQNINSYAIQDSIITKTLQQPKNLSINQDIRYNKQISYKHTSTVTANYSYSTIDNDYDWVFNQPVFGNLIPFQKEGDSYHLLQNTTSIKHQVVIDLKHYWILNNFNHIYPRVGFTFLNDTFTSLDHQILQDGTSNGFQDDGFNNDTDFRLNDKYVGIQYKLKMGHFIFKSGVMFHSYFWKINQFSEEVTNKQKNVWLPELNIKYDVSSAEKIEFNYQLNTSFSNSQNFANRLRLANFNQIYHGNENLENELYHTAFLNYIQFNMYKGIYINANFSYTKRDQSVRSVIQIDGIDQINTSIYTSLPENSYSFTGSFGKQISNYRLTFLGNLNFADYSRLVNDQLLDYQSNNYGYTLKFETHFKKWPNFEIGWNQNLSDFNSKISKNNFTQINPYGTLDWNFLKDFILSTHYAYNYYKNLNTKQSNHSDIGNLSLYYNKEDSPWGFEIDLNNVFDVRFKNENTFNQFFVSDTNLFIQPRTILFILSYKF